MKTSKFIKISTDVAGYTSPGVKRNAGATASEAVGEVTQEKPEQSLTSKAVGRGLMRQSGGESVTEDEGGIPNDKTAEVSGHALFTRKSQSPRSMLAHALKNLRSKDA